MRLTSTLLAALLCAGAQHAAAQSPDCATGDPAAVLRCEQAALADAEQALNKEYRGLARTLHDNPAPDAQAALRTLTRVQRDWIGWRDDDCDAVFLAHDPGALRERYRLRCKRLHAEARIRQLEAYRPR